MKKTRKRLISLLLGACLLSALLAGCGSSGEPAAEGSGETPAAASGEDVLYHCYNSLPYITLDPSVEYSNGIITLQNVYETLTRYNSETTEVDPLLATSWSSNEDGTEWTFQLRDDVTFHDGSPFTSADVKASIDRTKSLGQGASYNWDCVDEVECTGDYEVVFRLNTPAPLDLIASAGYASYIMSEEVVDKDTEWFNEGNDGGSGPYIISQADTDTVVLTAYEDYWGGWDDSQYKTVLIKEVDESSARRQMLETGEAQLSSNFSSTDLLAMREETDKLTVVPAETFTNAIGFLNSEKAPCDNVDFRKCLQYAFPYKDAVEGVLDGNAAYAVGLVTAGLWGHDDSLPVYTTDLDKAAECLEASGVDTSGGIDLEVTYMSGNASYDSILQLWQSNLKPMGINLNLRSMEWDAQWDEAQATNPAERQDIFVMLWWPDYASPNSWFDSLIHSEDAPYYNLAYINDPEIDGWIEEADSLAATDRDAAADLYIKVQQKLYDEAYLVQMYDEGHTYVISNAITVDGVIENPAYATAVPYYNIHKVS